MPVPHSYPRTRYMGSPAGQILEAVPGLALWLRRVFWVMGGYIVTTGALVLYVANTGLRAGDTGALGMLALPGQHRSGGWPRSTSCSDQISDGHCSASNPFGSLHCCLA